MGGDNSPNKIIDGIVHHHKSNQSTFYKIFGDEDRISKLLNNKISKNNYEVVNTLNKVSSEDSPLEAAKRGKDTAQCFNPQRQRRHIQQQHIFYITR